MTCVVILHGRGESIAHGMAHVFANKLRIVLRNKNLTNFDVIEVGLSQNSDEDNEWSSFKSMDFQMQKLCKYINDTELDKLQENCTRIDLVGCSQGALLLRGLLWGQCLDSVTHKIDKFITFGGPNNGIFGVPNCKFLSDDLKFLLFGCRLLERTLNITGMGPSVYDSFIYGSQQILSFASYWNSPKNIVRLTTFLADINNENSINKTKYLSEKVKEMVVISFEKDSIILPQISASFGYWDWRANQLIPFNETEYYQKDSFGLKSLNERNGLKLKTIANSTHMSIPLSFISDDFLNYIK